MTTEQEIRVLVVEGSADMRALLIEILQSDPRIKVTAVAGNGREALAELAAASVDVVLMDIDLPQKDGFETTRQIMETKPIPIVICADGSTDAIATFRLTEMGAVAGVQKPQSRSQLDFAAVAYQLLNTVRLMSEIKVVRRWRRVKPEGQGVDQNRPIIAPRSRRRFEAIGIGASTGGPPVLQAILAALPKDFPVPILIVQHIAPGFLSNLVEWLNHTTGFCVQIASDYEKIQPGRAYVAPDDRHMEVRADGAIVLSGSPAESGVRPSVSRLLRSLANVHGANAVGVLLTGMGRDGADELKLMKDRGAFTIAQDRESSVVYGMPAEAVKIGGASLVLPPDRIAPALIALINTPITSGPQ